MRLALRGGFFSRFFYELLTIFSVGVALHSFFSCHDSPFPTIARSPPMAGRFLTWLGDFSCPVWH